MRPYLAVIRDSFHEALVSRVLWILIALMTLVLLLLSPLGIHEQAGSVLQEDDFLTRQTLVKKIVTGGQSSEPSPGHRIWELLDESQRQAFERQVREPDNRMRFFAIIEALQKVMSRKDLYRESDWAGVKLPPEAMAIDVKGLDAVPQAQVLRFNRLALESAFPDEIAPAPPKQFQATYLSWELGLPLPFDAKQIKPFINSLVAVVMGTMLGVAGVFVAILVTASMIPQTFEAGSVDLLLSKPVSRGWLFLAKFVGGCAFTAINAAYFIGGLWLLLGMRFDIWNHRLLLAIPLYVFLFAIYYGVSAVAGVIWRNTIVSVGVTIAFWFVCFALGVGNNLVSALSLQPRKIVSLVEAGQTLIAVNSQNDVFRWDSEDRDWKRIFAARGEGQSGMQFGARLAGPIYDASQERILAFRSGMAIFAQIQGSPKILIGKRDEDWRRNEGVGVPDGAATLFMNSENKLIIAASTGIYRAEGDLAAKQPDINIFGLRVPLPQQGGKFQPISPKQQMRVLESAAMDPQSGAVALFDGSRLVTFVAGSTGGYTQAAEVTFDERRAGQVALAGGKVYLAGRNGEIETYDLQLESGEPIDSQLDSLPQRAVVSPDGKWLALLFRDSKLWLYDLKRGAASTLSLTGQGDISGVAFNGEQLLVADRLTRVTRYDLATGKRLDSIAGHMPLAEQIYRYAVHPLYTIFPKPGEMNNVVTYVLQDKDAPQFTGPRGNDPSMPSPKVDVWGPIWSNLAFLAVVLSLGCLYVYRRDF